MSHTAWRLKNWEGNIGINTPWSAPALAFEQVHLWWLLQKRLTTTTVNSLPCNITKQTQFFPIFRFISLQNFPSSSLLYLLWTSRHCSCPSVCDFLYPLTLPRNLSPQMKTFLKECSRWERVRLPKNHHQVNLFAGHWPLDSRSREPISHQEKRSSGVFSAMIAPPVFASKMCRLI